MNAITSLPVYQSALTKFQALTKREKGIIILAVLVAISMLLYQIYEPIREAFRRQDERLASLELNMKGVGTSIERYMKLKARRDKIEADYKGIEFKEGALSHLETMVRSKAGITNGFTIKDSQPKEFAGSYEQTPFNIKFTTVSLDTLVEFLKELTHGPRPLIVSKVDLQKSKFADRLEVDIDASSIRKIK